MNELSALKKIWDYLRLDHPLEKADCIIAFGSFDVKVAELAAELYLEGYAKYLLMTGGLGKGTLGRWTKSESEIFAEIAFKKGVPENAVLIENESTNTGENIAFSKLLLQRKEIKVEKIIGVQKPFMGRRLYAALKKQWPELECMITSPKMEMEAYFIEIINTGMSREDLIAIMLGDLVRIKTYVPLGYQIPQEIPNDICESYRFLLDTYCNVENGL